MKKAIFVFLFFIAIPLLAIQHPRVTITGRVSDQQNGEPLYFANVFLSNTTLGCATDKQGYFTIENVPMGRFDVVCSMAGYELESQIIQLSGKDPEIVNFSLKPKPYKAPSITITAPEPVEWKHYFRKFELAFLGLTDNAFDCKITNAMLLEFNFNPQTGALRASSPAPLEIINHALGYKIIYHLMDFTSHDPINSRYLGRSFYSELKPNSASEEKRWKKNRKKAWEGSFRHFMSALFSNRLNEEGFYLYSVWDLAQGQRYFGVRREEILKPGNEAFEMILEFEDYLKIVYFKAVYEEVSYLELSPGTRVVFNVSGFINNPYSLTRYGHWARDRVSEDLPLDFIPEK